MDHDHERYTDFLQMFNSVVVENNWHKFITPGSTAIDIGGHSGDTAIPMQYLARGTVLSVEPNPRIKPYLDFNCSVNAHLGKFVTAGYAVTTQDIDALEIFDHNNDLCNGGTIDPTWTPELQERMRNMSGKQVTVQGKTLEHICQQYLTEDEINNISFIKTDTEGHDVSILESSSELIDRLKPVIYTEWFFAYTDIENKKMFDVINQIGYQAFNPKTLEPVEYGATPIPDLLLIHKTKINDYL
jgi:FkbM family methyltransferase